MKGKTIFRIGAVALLAFVLGWAFLAFGAPVTAESGMFTADAPVAGVNSLTFVMIDGPTTGVVSNTYRFTTAISATQPFTYITYTWYPEPLSGQGTETAEYVWGSAGNQMITVIASSNNSTVTGTHTIAISMPTIPVASVAIDGPTTGIRSSLYTFTAVVNPTNASAPLTYQWSPTPVSGQGTASARYGWASTGTKTITVIVSNGGAPTTDTHTINIKR